MDTTLQNFFASGRIGDTDIRYLTVDKAAAHSQASVSQHHKRKTTASTQRGIVNEEIMCELSNQPDIECPARTVVLE